MHVKSGIPRTAAAALISTCAGSPKSYEVSDAISKLPPVGEARCMPQVCPAQFGCVERGCLKDRSYVCSGVWEGAFGLLQQMKVELLTPEIVK